jgi:cobalt-zinc-cadmium resistance protein CzcA
MAYTITSALIGSLLFSLTLVPVLCVYLMRRSLPEKETFIVRVAHRIYHRVLKRFCRGPKTYWRPSLAG